MSELSCPFCGQRWVGRAVSTGGRVRPAVCSACLKVVILLSYRTGYELRAPTATEADAYRSWPELNRITRELVDAQHATPAGPPG